MSVSTAYLDVTSTEYQQSYNRTMDQVQLLNQRLQEVTLSSMTSSTTTTKATSSSSGSSSGSSSSCLDPERAAMITRHYQRNKLLARERLQQLVDPGTPLLELSPLVANSYNNNNNNNNINNDPTPTGAGIVTAIGVIAGRLMMMIANDATVKGGTYFPLTVKKHLRAQQIAQQNALPCLYLVDSGGAYLPEQSNVFPDQNHFGRIFYHQAQLSAANISQISIVCGSCTAGGAYVPCMSDETIIVQGASIFLGGPPLVQAATGQVVSSQELGGAHVHTEISGVADHYASTEWHAIQKARDIITNLASDEKNNDNNCTMSYEEPLYDPMELRGIVPLDMKHGINMKLILARILDGSRFEEFKTDYGTTLLCGFGTMYGQQVGIIANQGILFSESALKGTHFVQLCCQRGIPIVFLQNITGFMVGSKYEHEGYVLFFFVHVCLCCVAWGATGHM